MHVLETRPRVRRQRRDRVAADQPIILIQRRGVLAPLFRGHVDHRQHLVFQCDSGRSREAIVTDVANHRRGKNERLDTVQQVLLRGVSGRLLKEVNNNIGGAFAVKIDGPVFPHEAQGLLIDFGAQNLEIRLRERIHIVCLFSQSLVVRVDQRQNRFKNAATGVVEDTLYSRNAVKPVGPLVCPGDITSGHIKVAHGRRVADAAMPDLVGAHVGSYKIQHAGLDTLVVDRKGLHGIQTGRTDLAVLVDVANAICPAENRDQRGPLGIDVVAVCRVVNQVDCCSDLVIFRSDFHRHTHEKPFKRIDNVLSEIGRHPDIRTPRGLFRCVVDRVVVVVCLPELGISALCNSVVLFDKFCHLLVCQRCVLRQTENILDHRITILLSGSLMC